MWRLGLLLAAAVSLWGCSSSAPERVESAAVLTESGRVTPIRTGQSALRWLDIPYARPPIGPYRWQPPQPLAPSQATLGRQAADVMCAQPASETSGVTGGGFVGSEDCLYLDIVAPQIDAGTQLPVMFWIHGGGNTTGRKGTYDFTALAERESVVVVTINYRLGPLGWFAHPKLNAMATGDARSPNFGTLDIIAALEWVQRNISEFGGDAANVTVFGESAGGRNVLSLLASPKAQGLFDGAIVQSGHLRSLTRDQAHNAGRAHPHVDRGSWEVVRALGLDNTTVSDKTLRDVSTQRLLAAYYGLSEDHLQPAIIADGLVIPESGLVSALADPANRKSVPVLIGSNRDEVTLWLGLNRYFVDGSYPLTRWGPPKLRVKDPALFSFWVSARSRAWKARGVDLPLQLLTDAGYDALYAYRFDWDEQADNWLIPFSELLGAAHASEIAFVMGAPFYGSIGAYMYPDTESAAAMTETMMSTWGSFAHRKTPAEVAGMRWPKWSPNGPQFMVLDAGEQQSRLVTGRESIDALLAEVAASSLLDNEQRCILAWEITTAVGQPDYQAYRDAVDGYCAEVDVPMRKAAIRSALIEQFGSADLP